MLKMVVLGVNLNSHPHSVLKLLLRQEDKNLRQIAFFTLDKMARGGIYDQLGGGFSRYSVDEAWLVPPL